MTDKQEAAFQPGDTEQLSLDSWVGNTDTQRGWLGPGLGSTLRGVLGLPGVGDPDRRPPDGTHWLLFDGFVPAHQIGPDGHPQRGGLLPPVGLPRRMWAGGVIDFMQPLPVDEPLTRTRRVQSVTEKAGRNGPLVFIAVEHRIQAGSELLIRERQDLAYTNIGALAPRDGDASEAARAPWKSTVVRPDTVMLFRYSALTRNSHRIHYDADYARDVERYPTLVVHGPLTASLLMWFAGECAAGRPLRRFEFRGRAPLFVDEDIVLEANQDREALDLSAGTSNGMTGMTAKATF